MAPQHLQTKQPLSLNDWHQESDGSFHFHDGSDYAVFSDAGPQLLHLRNARLDDVLRRLNAC